MQVIARVSKWSLSLNPTDLEEKKSELAIISLW
jgi:hypothetical protein